MDGTLVDTEPYWMRAEQELVRQGGGAWTDEDGLRLVGLSLPDAARLLKEAGAPGDVDGIYQHLTDRVDELLRTEGIPFRPGARELLLDLRAAGTPTALVTMSLRRMAETVAGLIDPDAGPPFDVIVPGDEVPRPKPFPDPYLKAAELLGVDIADTLVIEDSPTGLRAGIASGAVTLGVPNLVALDGVGADALWPTLAGRAAADLADLFAAHRDAADPRNDPQGAPAR